MDGLEELKILYSELQTYLWVTRLFIEQNSDSAEVVEALRKLKGQIVEHSEYLAQRPDTLDRGTPELDQLYNSYLNTSIQELTTLSAELGGDFQIQAGPSNADIKKKVDQLLAAFKNANLGKTNAARKAKLAEVQKSSLSLLKGFSKVKAFGPGGRGKAILSALRTIGEIALTARDIQLSLEEINEECLGEELEEKLKKIQAKNLKAIQNYKQLLDKIGSDPCLENADPALLEEIVQRVLGAGDAALTQGSLAPIQTKYDRLLEAIQQVKMLASESDVRGILAEADELLGLLDHFVGNAQKYLKELDEECQNNCKTTIAALENFMNQNILSGGNLKSLNPEPPFIFNDPRKENNQGKSAYDDSREAYYKNNVFNSAFEIDFMAHIIARHGGTKRVERSLSYNNDSQFYSDRWAFLAAIQALKIRNTLKDPKDSEFLMPSPWQKFSFSFENKVYSGQGIGFGKVRNQIKHTPYAYYRFASPTSCRLITLHAAFPDANP